MDYETADKLLKQCDEDERSLTEQRRVYERIHGRSVLDTENTDLFCKIYRSRTDAINETRSFVLSKMA